MHLGRARAPRHRQMVLLALAATLAALITVAAAGMMHPASSGLSDDQASAGLHATAHVNVGPGPVAALGDEGCSGGCGSEHEGLVTACAMLMMTVALAMLLRAHRPCGVLLPVDAAPPLLVLPALRIAAPDLRVLCISRT